MKTKKREHEDQGHEWFIWFTLFQLNRDGFGFNEFIDVVEEGRIVIRVEPVP